MRILEQKPDQPLVAALKSQKAAKKKVQKHRLKAKLLLKLKHRLKAKLLPKLKHRLKVKHLPKLKHQPKTSSRRVADAASCKNSSPAMRTPQQVMLRRFFFKHDAI
jgi:plasmid rolling circle replication initiator protein Rep